MNEEEPVIGIVGPCASGKSTLVADLHSRGFRARHIAQEHSYVQDMWKQITNPDVLIYLDVSYATSIKRTGLKWSRVIYDNQIQRLVHAKKHADMYINTEDLSPDQVLDYVLEKLRGIVAK